MNYRNARKMRTHETKDQSNHDLSCLGRHLMLKSLEWLCYFATFHFVGSIYCFHYFLAALFIFVYYPVSFGEGHRSFLK